MPTYGLHWLPMNNVYFNPYSDTVVVGEAWKSLACVVSMSRRHWLQHCENNLYALQKDEDAQLHYFLNFSQLLCFLSAIVAQTDYSRSVWLLLLWLLKSGTPGLISLSNNDRQETKELQEIVQLCIKPIKTEKQTPSIVRINVYQELLSSSRVEI